MVTHGTDSDRRAGSAHRELRIRHLLVACLFAALLPLAGCETHKRPFTYGGYGKRDGYVRDRAVIHVPGQQPIYVESRTPYPTRSAYRR